MVPDRERELWQQGNYIDKTQPVTMLDGIVSNGVTADDDNTMIDTSDAIHWHHPAGDVMNRLGDGRSFDTELPFGERMTDTSNHFYSHLETRDIPDWIKGVLFYGYKIPVGKGSPQASNVDSKDHVTRVPQPLKKTRSPRESKKVMSSGISKNANKKRTEKPRSLERSLIHGAERCDISDRVTPPMLGRASASKVWHHHINAKNI